MIRRHRPSRSDRRRALAEGLVAMLLSAVLARVIAPAAFLALSASPLAAFDRVQAPAAKPEMVENCPGAVASRAPRVTAALRLALNSDQVRFTYVGHSTFLIESPQLVRIAT